MMMNVQRNYSKKEKKSQMSYTDQEILTIITEVATKLAPKYVFGYFSVEDIRQEAIMMGYEALPRYDTSRPLHNFLYVHISNRLKTFKRDNFYRQNAGNAESMQQAKKNIMNPVSIENVDFSSEPDFIEDIYINEIRERINKNLPAKLRKDYLRVCAGAKISKNAKQKLVEAIREIFENDK